MRRAAVSVILTVAVWGSWCVPSQAAENLVFNGDFEAAATESPPPGWAMWGAEAYKDPANYTRDTAQPHSGAACFRIHHPAGTAGYIVVSPDKALRPQANRKYTLTFWARADTPGPAVVRWVAYESLQPFVDAPWPREDLFEVSEQWQQHRYEVTEAWDFFADRSRYLMPSFVATPDAETERTLWVDDVTVTEEPSEREGRLLDETRLQYEPLNHRLRPGDRLEFTVDTGHALRPATRMAGGISFHRVCGWTGEPYDREGRYTLDPRLEQAIRDLRLPMTRLYGVGDEPFGLEGALDRAAELVDRVGVPQASTVLELETQGATSRLAPEVWARAAAYCRQQGYGFRCWEVANEPYIRLPDSAFTSPDDYLEHVQAVSKAVRAAQPDAQIGLAICASPPWGNYLLRRAAGSYDFVVHHYYASVAEIHRRKFEVAVLTENYALLDRALQVNALVRAYNPGREVVQLDTEWGVHSAGPNGEVADSVDRNANVYGTVHRAVRLIYYVREGMLRGAGSWQMLNRVSHQGFGVLAQEAPDRRFMVYWLYYYLNRHVGETALDLQGTAPYYTPGLGDDPLTAPGSFPGPLTPVLATLSGDGRELYLVLANGSWSESVRLQAELRGFAAQEVSAVVLSGSDPDGKPLLERREDFVRELPLQLGGDTLTGELPPHSVTFVTLKAG